MKKIFVFVFLAVIFYSFFLEFQVDIESIFNEILVSKTAKNLISKTQKIAEILLKIVENLIQKFIKFLKNEKLNLKFVEFSDKISQFYYLNLIFTKIKFYFIFIMFKN